LGYATRTFVALFSLLIYILIFPKKSLGFRGLGFRVYELGLVTHVSLSADKQVNSDTSPSHQDKGNASPTTDTGDKQVNGDASPSH
jgi:hypothetical protein